MLSAVRIISEAAELAARRHNGMARKGRGNEPYINHLAEVANRLAKATDGADAELVAAGWLHDVIEDTDTTRDELARTFSERVAALVVECTDDMTLPKAERRRLQVVDAPKKSASAKLIKIADKISNIGARINPDPASRSAMIWSIIQDGPSRLSPPVVAATLRWTGSSTIPSSLPGAPYDGRAADIDLYWRSCRCCIGCAWLQRTCSRR
jgi:guanosine-3',5'-bis(diphosphate) 3'-pyrophosphohydrolase